MALKIKNKTLVSEKLNFTEAVGEDGKKTFYLEGLIVPYGEISRNGYLYNVDSIKSTYKELMGKHLMFNHKTNGPWDESKPRGEWVETWLEDDGMHGKARVYNTNYNAEFIEFLEEASNPRVSLNVDGIAEQRKNNERVYSEATITDWLETSVVTTPGFDVAKSTFMQEMRRFNESIREAGDKDNKEAVLIIDDTAPKMSDEDEEFVTSLTDTVNKWVESNKDLDEESFLKKVYSVIKDWSKLLGGSGIEMPKKK